MLFYVICKLLTLGYKLTNMFRCWPLLPDLKSRQSQPVEPRGSNFPLTPPPNPARPSPRPPLPLVLPVTETCLLLSRIE